MTTIFYDKDADLKVLSGLQIGIMGYGIQGRAHALNLRDSGCHVRIANRQDAYRHLAQADGFLVEPLETVVSQSDILFLLIPDHAHRPLCDEVLSKFFKAGGLLIFAHGYALRFESLNLLKTWDVAMLAPRMPGHHIRAYYLENKGVPAFIDIAQDASQQTLSKVLALAKAIGFTRAGVIQVPFSVEAELDLFIEQFLIPNMIKSITLSFETLVNEYHYPAVATLMELYASGELAEVLKLASQQGIGAAFQKNASPTCQFGISEQFEEALTGNPSQRIHDILLQIRNGSFQKALTQAGLKEYEPVHQFWKKNISEDLISTQSWIASHVGQPDAQK